MLQATAAKLTETEEEKTRLTVRGRTRLQEVILTVPNNYDDAVRSFQAKLSMLDSHLKSQQALIAKLHQQHALELNQQAGQVRHWTYYVPLL